ncbi:RDD family protein [Streptomyces ficellus]|uniref:RDD family protein n=1 Tax=Streptomyces ficellus TaxID=1977088 RepID=A0ABT7Z135_9ACTN|nr:RDD family protein [Streptomyces ficellus]MDN3293197.1 RDD family protein [Streptomyces ficellus]
MNGVVTGDAVVLGLQPARLPSRALALAIDLVVVWAAYLLISVGLAVATASLDEAAVMAVSIATFLLVLVGAPIAVETLTRGRSLGKMACGLRVVRDDGGPIRFRHALVRGAIGVFEILMTFGVVACIASLVSARGRRIGDVFAGTLVVRERVPAARTVAVPPPPPWLVGRFAQLDLSAVPDDLWLAIRQYLTRMRQLDAEVGRALAERLADDLVALTGAPPPPGVPAVEYLAGVMNERQARDARRTFAPRGDGPTTGHGPSAGIGGTPGVGGAAGIGGAPGVGGAAAVGGSSAGGGAKGAAGAVGVFGAPGGGNAAGVDGAGVAGPAVGGWAAVGGVSGAVSDRAAAGHPAGAPSGEGGEGGQGRRTPPATGFAPPA